MSEQKLVFNGVRPDGSYALAPKTAKALAERIWSARDRAAELEQQFDQAFKNANKVVEIVDFLVEGSLVQFDGEAVTKAAWLEALARQLLVTILGEKFATVGNVRALAEKLQDETRQKVELIVTAFVKRGGGANRQELEALLLPQTADKRTNYKEMLKQQVEHWGGAIRDDLLASTKAVTLASQPGARAVWLSMLCRRLRELPIESLKTLTEHHGIVSTPLKRLVADLGALPDAGSAWVAQLIQDLEPISTRGRRASWPEVAGVLEADMATVARADGPVVAWDKLLDALAAWLTAMLDGVAKLGAVAWVDPKKLDEAGWGIVFPAKMAAARVAVIKKALDPLLKLREEQAQGRYKVIEGGLGYRPGEDARAFLGRFGANPADPADPGKTGVPYYLLLVGSPEEIPFEFQYGLDVQYAVGRIDFGDDMEAYANYARSVVAAEQEGFKLAPEAVFVGIENPGDEATELSTKHLVAPIAERLEKRLKDKQDPDADPAWTVTVVPSKDATREKLLDIVHRAKAPAFLFTASHGLEVGPDDPEQQAKQGALVCADWKGPGNPVDAGFYLSGAALTQAADANMLGTIAFLFACYGAGTPKTDDYFRQDFEERGEVIADPPFVAALPKAMLSLKNGGALAVVGHVERVWSLSFVGPEQHSVLGEARRAEHVAVFESMIDRLLDGHPVGSAMDYFDVRYAALATELAAAFDAFNAPDDFELAELWTANHDARGYIIIGDPAVRLKVARRAAEAVVREDFGDSGLGNGD